LACVHGVIIEGEKGKRGKKRTSSTSIDSEWAAHQCGRKVLLERALSWGGHYNVSLQRVLSLIGFEVFEVSANGSCRASDDGLSLVDGNSCACSIISFND
jgi:hypothetical protein